jgi:hypothetical protein
MENGLEFPPTRIQVLSHTLKFFLLFPFLIPSNSYNIQGKPTSIAVNYTLIEMQIRLVLPMKACVISVLRIRYTNEKQGRLTPNVQ